MPICVSLTVHGGSCRDTSNPGGVLAEDSSKASVLIGEPPTTTWNGLHCRTSSAVASFFLARNCPEHMHALCTRACQIVFWLVYAACSGVGHLMLHASLSTLRLPCLRGSVAASYVFKGDLTLMLSAENSAVGHAVCSTAAACQSREAAAQ